MHIAFEGKIGRSDLRGEEVLTGPRANTPRGSFSANPPLPYRKFTQALLDIGALIVGFLLIASVAFSLVAPFAIMILFML